MTTKMPERFKAQAKSLGVRTSETTGPDGKPEIFIHNDDARFQRTIMTLAQECGLEIVICDKGAAFK